MADAAVHSTHHRVPCLSLQAKAVTVIRRASHIRINLSIRLRRMAKKCWTTRSRAGPVSTYILRTTCRELPILLSLPSLCRVQYPSWKKESLEKSRTSQLKIYLNLLSLIATLIFSHCKYAKLKPFSPNSATSQPAMNYRIYSVCGPRISVTPQTPTRLQCSR